MGFTNCTVFLSSSLRKFAMAFGLFHLGSRMPSLRGSEFSVHGAAVQLIKSIAPCGPNSACGLIFEPEEYLAPPGKIDVLVNTAAVVPSHF